MKRPRTSLDFSLFKVGRVWHYRFQVDGARQQRSTGETDRTAAHQVAEEAFAAAKLRARGEEPEPTLAQAFAGWVTAHALRKSASHVRNVEACGRLHLGALADLKLTELTTARVEEGMNAFLEGHAQSTTNQWLTYIRIVCKWAIRRRMIRAMPFDVPEIKIAKAPKTLIPFAKVADWLDQVDALTEHEPAIGLVIRIMIGVGLRIGEAQRARWEWLNLEAETYTPGYTKGGAAVARPVPPWLLEDLRLLAQPMGWMLPTLAGMPVSYGRVARVIEAACEAVEIPRVTPHRLRGTYATWLHREGCQLLEIQKALEHKDSETTQGYIEVDLQNVAQAQRRIAQKAGIGRRESGEAIA